jgi:hypothetical protein
MANFVDLTEPDVIDLTESPQNSPYAAETRSKRKSRKKLRRRYAELYKQSNPTRERYRPHPRTHTREPIEQTMRRQFILLCRKHIMVQTLDSVFVTAQLSNKNSTIFLIGEHHAPHTKCVAILDMFKKLIKENSAHTNPVPIDLMIEVLQSNVDSIRTERENSQSYDSDYENEMKFLNERVQGFRVHLEEIREYFANCIADRNCKVRVHWTDPNENLVKDDTDRYGAENYPRKDKKPRKYIPDWLVQLGYTGHTRYTPYILQHFDERHDIPKLILENPIIMKEIKKASKVNPAFNLDFALHHLNNFIENQYEGREKIFWLTRSLMEIYSAARIVKSNMKHVIYYAGAQHIMYLIAILTSLDYKLVDYNEKKGECTPPPSKHKIWRFR